MTAQPEVQPVRRVPAPRPGRETLLEVRELRTSFSSDEGPLHAVDRISFSLARGEALALVGESGSGKSVTALSIMGLVQTPGRITHGEVLFKGRDLVGLPEKEMRKVRGNDIAMIFQEPMTSLNPVFTVGNQIEEAIRLHRGVSRKEARNQAIEALRLVAIPDPEKRVDDYPHQMSGGMRQRVMIAMALSCDPELLIADEPTTALDVTIQAQIMEILGRLQQQLGLSVLLITHDLGIVAEFCERVIVMYTGRIVEEAPVQQLFDQPSHPYTKGLLNSLPKLTKAASGERQRLEAIPGMVPPLTALPKGCKFNTRCPFVMDICYGDEPARILVGEDHDARCYLYGELADPEHEESR